MDPTRIGFNQPSWTTDTLATGSHDRHRLSSDTGPRTMYRVYRSGISTDSAMDEKTLTNLEKKLGWLGW